MSVVFDTGIRSLAALQTAIAHNGQTHERDTRGHMVDHGKLLISQQMLSALLDDGHIEIDIADRYVEGDGAQITVCVTSDGRKHLAVQLCIAVFEQCDPDGDDFDDIFDAVGAYFDPENWA